MEGVRHVVPVEQTAVAVVATRWWQAKKALDALSVVWDEPSNSELSSDKLRVQFRQSLDHPNPIDGLSQGGCRRRAVLRGETHREGIRRSLPGARNDGAADLHGARDG